jgi:hypothetical protein
MTPVLPFHDKGGKKYEFEEDKDSDDEWMNQDFFESSAIW